MEAVSNKQSWFVVNTLVTPVFLLTTVTVTSGRMAPLTSVTTPRISPAFILCANPTPGRLLQAATANAIVSQLNLNLLKLILPPKYCKWHSLCRGHQIVKQD